MFYISFIQIARATFSFIEINNIQSNYKKLWILHNSTIMKIVFIFISVTTLFFFEDGNISPGISRQSRLVTFNVILLIDDDVIDVEIKLTFFGIFR